jgi:hypothetical protein
MDIGASPRATTEATPKATTDAEDPRHTRAGLELERARILEGHEIHRYRVGPRAAVVSVSPSILLSFMGRGGAWTCRPRADAGAA